MTTGSLTLLKFTNNKMSMYSPLIACEVAEVEIKPGHVPFVHWMASVPEALQPWGRHHGRRRGSLAVLSHTADTQGELSAASFAQPGTHTPQEMPLLAGTLLEKHGRN